MPNLRAELRAELETIDAFRYRPGLVYAKAALLFAASVGMFAASVVIDTWWLKIPMFVAGLCVNVSLVMIGHDAGHGAISRRAWVNDLLGYGLFTLIGGLPLAYWKWKHNTMHHSYPNVAGKDPDVSIYPFAMHDGQRAEQGFRGFIQRHQAGLFWPITLFTVFTMRVDAVRWHLTVGRRVATDQERVWDAAMFALHLTGWLIAPSALFGVSFGWALFFYSAWTMAAGVLLAAIFLPAHMDAPLYGDYEENFVLQLRTTQNLRTNRLFSFLLIGLDHQVEHHLFQRMSHLQLGRVAPCVRRFCERHQLPYEEKGWGAALASTTRRLGVLPETVLVPRPPPVDDPPSGPR